MPRVPQITEKTQVAEEHHPIFDSIVASRGQVTGPFSVLINSPEVAGRAAHLGTYLRFESAIEPKMRELAIITTAREWDCALEWGSHGHSALRQGVREEAVSIVGRKAPVDGLNDDEKFIVEYVRELVRTHHVSDETFAKALEKLGVQGVTDLTGIVGYYGMLACALNAFDVPARANALPMPAAES